MKRFFFNVTIVIDNDIGIKAFVRWSGLEDYGSLYSLLGTKNKIEMTNKVSKKNTYYEKLV